MNDQDQQATLVDDLESCVLGSMATQPREDPLLDRFVRRDAIDGGVTADRLFRTLTRGTPVEGLQVVARPGDLLDQPLLGGDLLLRVAIGEPRLGHVAVLVDGLLEPPEALAAAGFQLEASGGGLYAHVIEAGARPHPRLARFARQVLEASGRVPPGQLLLRSTRWRGNASADESISSKTNQAPGLPQRSWQPMPLPQSCQTLLKGTRVAVVGGGLAGLMAARRLGQHGIKVTLFDGRWQVGGRVLSNHTFSNGRITEEGAELIGSFHTTWLALAREYGLAMISRMEEGLYLRAGLNMKMTLDKPLSMDEIIALDKDMEEVLRKIAVLASKIRNALEPWVPAQSPWLEEQELRNYDNMSVAHALEKLYLVQPAGPLWKAIQLLLVNDEVAPLETMNFLSLLCKVKGAQSVQFKDDGRNASLMRYWTELEVFRCADGCQKLADKLSTEIKDTYGAKVALSRAVTHIKLSQHDVTVGSKRVIKRDGTLAEGRPDFDTPYDYVILTVPPSVWSGVTITAIAADGKEAALNLDKEIGTIGMGDCVKFFSDVKERFWIRNKSAPYGGSLPLGQVWEGTDNQTRVEPRVAKQGIVLSVFAGPIRTDVQGLPRVPTPKEFTEELIKLYPDYQNNLNKDNLNKDKILFSNWPKEPFIKTGYAAPKISQIFKVGNKLTEPFRGRLFFGGEHTQLDTFGYMEGALRSGERAAHQLMLQACGLRKTPAPVSPRPQVLTASAAPIRQTTAFESESDIPSEEAQDSDKAQDDAYSLEVESAKNEFRFNSLPPKVQQHFSKGGAFWRDAVMAAIQEHIRDPTDLANLIFFMQYPGRMTAGVGKPIDKTEADVVTLRAEWNLYRTIAIGLMTPTAAKPAGAVFLPARSSENYEDYVAKRTTGRITLMINGRNSGGSGDIDDQTEAFNSMQETVESLQASDSIWLAAWQFIPTELPLTLKRAGGMNTWGDLFKSKASDGVKIRIIVSDLPPVAARFNSDLTPLNTIIGQLPASTRDNLKYIASRHSAPDIGSHHQKFMVVRRGRTTIAYCGGLDISRNRTPAGWGPNFVWHDIHAKLEGLIVRDLEREFVLRWNREKDKSSASPIRGWKDLERLAQAPVDSVDKEAGKNMHRLQMLRTVSVGTHTQDIRRDDIWQGYFRLIGSATRFMFMENQYFHEPKMADAIVKQAQAQLSLIVIIVVSSGTDDPQNVYTQHCLTRRHEFFRRLSVLPESRRRFYTVSYPDGLLHSKLMLVDDQVLTMGSANANPRGFFLDTELNVMLEDAEAVKRFRHRLWSHDLGALAANVAAWGVPDFIAQWDVVAKFNKGKTLDKMVGEGVIPFDPFDPKTPKGTRGEITVLNRTIGIPDVSC